MEFKDTINKRRSVRNYDNSKEVTDAQLKELFDTVSLSPSSYNLQPWEFIAVRDKDTKKQLKECANGQPFVQDASAVIIVLGNLKPEKNAAVIGADRMKKGLMDEAKSKRFEAAAKMLSEDKEKGKVWSIRSASLAAMTLMLAAQNMGLATCPMEGYNSDCVRELLSIPQEYELVMMVTLGYSKEPASERPMRFGYDKIVHLEKF